SCGAGYARHPPRSFSKPTMTMRGQTYATLQPMDICLDISQTQSADLRERLQMPQHSSARVTALPTIAPGNFFDIDDAKKHEGQPLRCRLPPNAQACRPAACLGGYRGERAPSCTVAAP